MPRILLCAATEFEIAPSLEVLARSGGKVKTLIAGVGLMETAYNLAAEIASSQPQFLVQAGIAGALGNRFPLTQTVAIRRDRVGDQGVVEDGRFRSTFTLGFGAPDKAPWKDGWLQNDSDLRALHSLEYCDAVSVNTITTDADRVAEYAAGGAEAESMEGAAFHYAALRFGIPFIQLRNFSNRVGERDKTKWTIRDSISSLNAELIHLLAKLESI